jgi:hypothetical protein
LVGFPSAMCCKPACVIDGEDGSVTAVIVGASLACLIQVTFWRTLATLFLIGSAVSIAAF